MWWTIIWGNSSGKLTPIDFPSNDFTDPKNTSSLRCVMLHYVFCHSPVIYNCFNYIYTYFLCLYLECNPMIIALPKTSYNDFLYGMEFVAFWMSNWMWKLKSPLWIRETNSPIETNCVYRKNVWIVKVSTVEYSLEHSYISNISIFRIFEMKMFFIEDHRDILRSKEFEAICK